MSPDTPIFYKVSGGKEGKVKFLKDRSHRISSVKERKKRVIGGSVDLTHPRTGRLHRKT